MMKTFLYFLILSLAFIPLSMSLADISLPTENIEALIKQLAKRQNLQLCRSEHDRGFFNGSVYYQRISPSCASYYAQAEALNGFFAGLADAHLDPDNLFLSCFELGWQLGFLSSHMEQWQPCSSELETKLEAAFRQTLARCQAQGKAVKKDLASLIGAMNQEDKDSTKDNPALLKLIIFTLLKNSRYEETWNMILTSQSQALIKLPCQAVFMESIL